MCLGCISVCLCFMLLAMYGVACGFVLVGALGCECFGL